MQAILKRWPNLFLIPLVISLLFLSALAPYAFAAAAVSLCLWGLSRNNWRSGIFLLGALAFGVLMALGTFWATSSWREALTSGAGITGIFSAIFCPAILKGSFAGFEFFSRQGRNPTRLIFRIVLLILIIVAVAAAFVSLWGIGIAEPAAWATVAAALAVLATVATAYTGQRVVELQEDSKEPNLSLTIDVRSRYSIAQFRITNNGGSAAHCVKVSWKRQLLDARGQEVTLARDKAISIIPEHQRASVALGLSQQFVKKYADIDFVANVTYKNSSGKSFSKECVVSAEFERVSLIHDEELPKTLFELQQIPIRLAEISKSLSNRSHK